MHFAENRLVYKNVNVPSIAMEGIPSYVKKSADIQKLGQERKGQSADIIKGLFDQIDQNKDVFEKALDMISLTGLSTKEAEEIMLDSTNPYIKYLLNFVALMPKMGLAVYEKFTKMTGGVFFKSDGALDWERVFINRALMWKRVLYPKLLKVLGKNYNQDLVEKAIENEFYNMDLLLATLAQGVDPSKKLVADVIRELKGLPSDDEKSASEEQYSRPASKSEYDLPDILDSAKVNVKNLSKEGLNKVISDYRYQLADLADRVPDLRLLNTLALDEIDKFSKIIAESDSKEDFSKAIEDLFKNFDTRVHFQPKIDKIRASSTEAQLKLVEEYRILFFTMTINMVEYWKKDQGVE